jgi:hypothetical protein
MIQRNAEELDPFFSRKVYLVRLVVIMKPQYVHDGIVGRDLIICVLMSLLLGREYSPIGHCDLPHPVERHRQLDHR